MDISLCLNTDALIHYHSEAQKIRVATEAWTGNHIFCPRCGGQMQHYKNNRPVADFYCAKCQEDFELKSKKNCIGRKITDGAYNTMIERIQATNNPHFYILVYQNGYVRDFMLIPNYFFTNEIIECRRPLSAKARRAGWQGCNILIDKIPSSARIYYIHQGVFIPPQHVIQQFTRTSFLKHTRSDMKGWLLDTMNIIDLIPNFSFSLQDVYMFEDKLKKKHPNNHYIKDKLRQQLQFLRDKGYIEFVSKGHYRKVNAGEH